MSDQQFPPPAPAQAAPAGPLAAEPFPTEPFPTESFPTEPLSVVAAGMPTGLAAAGAPPATRGAMGWVLAALAGVLLSAVGAFLTVVKVGGQAVTVDDPGIGIPVPWVYRDRLLVLTLFERWDIAVALLLCAAAAAFVMLVAPSVRWPAAVGAVLAAVAFHIQLSIVERAEFRAIQRIEAPSYAIGAVLMVGGAFLALVSFIAVLLRRQ